MTNRNRPASAAYLSNEYTQRNASQLQLRSSVFPIIELGGGVTALTANVATPIPWNEIIRQTDQPLNEWRGNNVGNYVWPRFISGGSGSSATDVRINVSGYYQIFLSVVLNANNAARLTATVTNKYGQTTAAPQVLGSSTTTHTLSATVFIQAGSYVTCSITSTIANQLNVNSTFPSPRLIITQLAQYYDTPEGAMTRVRSTLTNASTTGVAALGTWDAYPSAAVSSSADMGVFNAGGSNQLQGFNTTANDRISCPNVGYYLFTAYTLQNAGTGAPGSRTRILFVTLNGTDVIASHSMGALINNVRDFSVSGQFYNTTAGSFIQMYIWQDTGAAMNFNPQFFSLVFLG